MARPAANVDASRDRRNARHSVVPNKMTINDSIEAYLNPNRRVEADVSQPVDRAVP